MDKQIVNSTYIIRLSPEETASWLELGQEAARHRRDIKRQLRAEARGAGLERCRIEDQDSDVLELVWVAGPYGEIHEPIAWHVTLDMGGVEVTDEIDTDTAQEAVRLAIWRRRPQTCTLRRVKWAGVRVTKK